MVPGDTYSDVILRLAEGVTDVTLGIPQSQLNQMQGLNFHS